MLSFLCLFVGTSLAQEEVASSASPSLIESVLQANIIVQITFVILILMSIVSWSIILTKRKMFRLTEVYNAPFQDVFQKAQNLNSIYEVGLQYKKVL